jgi:hypothetical protein
MGAQRLLCASCQSCSAHFRAQSAPSAGPCARAPPTAAGPLSSSWSPKPRRRAVPDDGDEQQIGGRCAELTSTAAAANIGGRRGAPQSAGRRHLAALSAGAHQRPAAAVADRLRLGCGRGGRSCRPSSMLNQNASVPLIESWNHIALESGRAAPVRAACSRHLISQAACFCRSRLDAGTPGDHRGGCWPASSARLARPSQKPAPGHTCEF